VNARVVGVIVFASTFGAALLAMRLHILLPKHYFDTESKDTVKVGIGLIATHDRSRSWAGHCLRQELFR
jgi:hypothetical protein